MFAELGQCILQQVYTFMREENLERYLKVEGTEPMVLQKDIQSWFTSAGSGGGGGGAAKRCS